MRTGGTYGRLMASIRGRITAPAGESGKAGGRDMAKNRMRPYPGIGEASPHTARPDPHLWKYLPSSYGRW